MSKPKKNFNTCDDFLQLIVSSFMVTAALEVLGMKSLSSSPSSEFFDPETVMTKSKSERKKVLEEVCDKIVKKFIPLEFHKHPGPSNGDKIQEYSMNLLSIGSFYLEFEDAIREGDGKRVLRCWKYLLPIFRYSGRRNYCVEAFKLLFQYYYALPPRQAEQLIWSRFVNTHGTPGRNIPLDLHLEHLNRLCKNSIQSLGPNRKNEAIVRCGRVLGTLHNVLNSFDEDNSIVLASGAHSCPSYEKEMKTIVDELLKSKVLAANPGRTHKTFPKPTNVLHAQPLRSIVTWLVEHLK